MTTDEAGDDVAVRADSPGSMVIRDSLMPPSPLLPAPAGELIRARYSCRTYRGEPITAEDRGRLSAFLEANVDGPLGSRARFRLVAASPGDQTALRRLGTYGFIKGATGFIVGAAQRAPKDLEDYGYLTELAVLRATGLGLGTCWLGGTFSKSSFAARLGGLGRHETMPAVVSTGYPGDDGTGRIREREEGSRRLPSSELFFDGAFGRPLLVDDPAFAGALEAVRTAPSASNKQPWRVVRDGGDGRDWHFYLRRTPRYGKGSALFTVLRLADLQRVDLGIAMCHFELVAGELGRKGSWSARDPRLPLPGPGVEYSATWRAKG